MPSRRKEGNRARIALDRLTGAQRRTLNLSAWASVAGSLILIAELGCVALAIAEILNTRSAAAAFSYLAAFLVLALARIAIEGVSTTLAANAAEEIKLHARRELSGAIAELSPVDRVRPLAGEIANLLTSHVDALGPYLTRYRPSRLRTAVIPPAVLIITAYFSWVAAAVLLVAGPLIPIFMALIGAEARSASERQLQQIGTMNAELLDRLQGLTTLRLFDAIPRAAESLLREGQEIRKRTMAVLRIAFISSAVLELFSALGVAFAAVYIGFSLLGYFQFGAYGGLSLTGALFVLMIAPEYFRPLRDFAAAYHDQASAFAACNEIEKLLDQSRRRLPTRSAETVPLVRLELDEVSVALGDTTILPTFSLHIERGECIALVGPSGTGKSMLLALIAGLVAPAGGRLSVNGRDDVSCTIAWLGQKPAFTQGSVKANLLMSRVLADRDGFDAAIRTAHAEDIIAKLERGYDEVLRENAANLSGGEAQRLAIARLALSKADLILADEPTEHLDADTAEAVIDGLFSSAKGRTLIVATHDARIVGRADRAIDVRHLPGKSFGAAA